MVLSGEWGWTQQHQEPSCACLLPHLRLPETTGRLLSRRKPEAPGTEIYAAPYMPEEDDAAPKMSQSARCANLDLSPRVPGKSTYLSEVLGLVQVLSYAKQDY